MERPIPSRWAPVFLFVSIAFLNIPITRSTQPAFFPSENVVTDGTTNVRATPDGALLGTQPKGASGVVSGGPVFVPGNSVTWYHVNFTKGLSGWVGGDMLIPLSTTPPPEVRALGTGTDQTMVLDEFGNINVGWVGVNNTYLFSESTNQGLTFSTPTTVPDVAVNLTNPPSQVSTIAVEKSGAIDVVFQCLPAQCPNNLGNPSVQLIRSTNHGATWSAPVRIGLPVRGSGNGTGEPVIAACGDGVTVVVQDDGFGADFNDLNPDIILVHVIGGVPGKPINLTNSAASEGHPQIEVNAQSNVFVTWVTDNNQGGGIATDSIVFASVPNCGTVSAN